MTTMTTIIDLMPLALGFGKHGSGTTQPMAITVIGGLAFALVLSLFFVPLVYRLTYHSIAVPSPETATAGANNGFSRE
jgi:multidrug efflux pump subunit AcrB